MTIDHSQVTVSNDSYPEQLKLYTEALKPLGYEVRMQFGPYHTGFGSPASDLSDYKRANFWLTGIEDKPNYKTHLAFTASDRAQVDAFHAAAMKNGGTDNGAPGRGHTIIPTITLPSSRMRRATTSNVSA